MVVATPLGSPIVAVRSETEVAVAKLIYSAIASLDGFIEDAGGSFDWAAPDAEVHEFVNDLERPIGTYLYGRRMYETMAYWDSPPDLARQPAHIRDFAAIWRAADKVVYSETLAATSTSATTIERKFDPEAVRRMKEGAAADISVGGPGLASTAVAANLVDEINLFLSPVAVGAGKPFLRPGIRLDLELVSERSFAAGVVHLRYRVEPLRSRS